MIPVTLQMEQEGDAGLIPVSVPIELARDEVDSIMTSVDVSTNSAYWSLEQAQPQRMTSFIPSSVSGGDSLTHGEKTQFILEDKRISPAGSSVIQQPQGQGSSLQDSRLVGVPTLGRVIPMAELSRSTVSEMRIVLQPEQKIEDDFTKLLGDQTSLISESTGMFIRSHENNREISKTDSSNQRSTISVQLSSLSESECVENKLTDKSFPSSILECYLAEYKSGHMYDSVWECDGGRFKVHRLVLASVSPLLKLVLSNHPGDVTRSVIFTPDLSAICVKSLLCLFYTGKVNIGGDLMTEVNMALKMLQFHGENMVLLPSQSIIKQESEELVGNFKQISQEKSSGKTRNHCKDEMKADSDEDWDPRQIRRLMTTSREMMRIWLSSGDPPPREEERHPRSRRDGPRKRRSRGPTRGSGGAASHSRPRTLPRSSGPGGPGRARDRLSCLWTCLTGGRWTLSTCVLAATRCLTGPRSSLFTRMTVIRT